MSARHYIALSAVKDNSTDLKELVAFLHTAISDCELNSVDETRDPAVLLLAAQLAFVTNTDVLSSAKYNRMISACKREVEKDVTAIRASENVH